MLGGKSFPHSKRNAVLFTANRIEEDGFGLVDLLHVALGFGIAGMRIGVVLFSQRTIRGLDFPIGSIPLYAKYLKIIYHALCLQSGE